VSPKACKGTTLQSYFTGGDSQKHSCSGDKGINCTAVLLAIVVTVLTYLVQFQVSVH
jgi:hypothetical protein